MALRIGIVGTSRWNGSGLDPSQVVVFEPHQPIVPSEIDLLVFSGLPPADAGALMATLPPTLPVLWLHGDAPPQGQVAASAATPLADPLTPRELEVFELMAKGLANREIAAALGVSRHTAKFHVAQILEKTGAATRTEAVRQGLRLGLIGL